MQIHVALNCTKWLHFLTTRAFPEFNKNSQIRASSSTMIDEQEGVNRSHGLHLVPDT